MYDLDTIDCPDCNGSGYEFGYIGQCDRCGGTGEINTEDASSWEASSFFSSLGKDE